jgi:hypothetical protein
MTALEFWKKHGPKTMREVCGLAGTTIEYFEHLAHGRKRASVAMADAIADASEKHTGIRIDPKSLRSQKEDNGKREAMRRERAAAFAASLAEAAK